MRLLIRTDAVPEIGGGHLVRCLALAETALGAGIGVDLAIARGAAMLEARGADRRIEVHPLAVASGGREDCEQTAMLADRSDAVVLDGYWFDRPYLDGLARHRVVLFDDMGRNDAADLRLVVNPNLAATAALYPGMPPGRLLLGPGFAPLRPMLKACRPKTTTPRPGRILVTFGAGSAGRSLSLLAGALVRRLPPGTGFDVVVGADGGDADGPGLLLHRSPRHLGPLLAAAGLIVTAGGSTLWEACYFGLPALVAVLADNQAGNAEALERLGAAISLGPADRIGADHLAGLIADLLVDGPRLARMAAAGRALVDGQGAERIIAALGARNRSATEPER